MNLMPAFAAVISLIAFTSAAAACSGELRPVADQTTADRPTLPPERMIGS